MSTPRDTVLITGGSGLIGSAVGKSLSERFQVVLLDVQPPRQPIRDAQYVSMDISSRSSIQYALGRVRRRHGPRIASVIHLAAYYSFSEQDSPDYEKITVRGTESLLAALQGFHVEQFVFSSTMLVHAPSSPGRKIDESGRIEAKWPYPRSKVQAERIIEEKHGRIPYVLLRIAGVYDDGCHSIPIAHQIERIYERHLTSHFYPGDLAKGQSFVHLDDLVGAVRRCVERRKELPADLALLLGEPETMSYGELQEEIGRLIHGKEWPTREIPKPAAKAGAWAQDVIPVGEEPFIKPWMVDLADDHYELDITRARNALGWQPEHRLRDALPRMIEALKKDPQAFFRENKLSPPVPMAVWLRGGLPLILGASGLALAYWGIAKRRKALGKGKQGFARAA